METQLVCMVEQIKSLRLAFGGDRVFLPVMGVITFFLSVKLIPMVTDMMVNSAAGLAGKHLGRQYRTLVINCSTNNPEVAMMLISLFVAVGAERYGGIGTPLGSNFANIYLIFLVALFWTLFRLFFRNKQSFDQLMQLIRTERKLVAWHLIMSFVMFLLAYSAFALITQPPLPAFLAWKAKLQLLGAAALCAIGIAVYVWKDAGLRKSRPELFEDIDEDDHVASWKSFAIGTVGLCICCFFMNVLFLAAKELYGAALTGLLGGTIFYMLHFFVGALVTSLPEMNVAVSNYERTTAPDLNTALSSASASNMSNLAIAGVGCLIAILFF